MTTQLSRERLEEIAALEIKTTDAGTRYSPKAYADVRSREIVDMARMLLAAMDIEPVVVDEIAEQAGIDPAIADAYMQGYHDSEARKPALVAVPDALIPCPSNNKEEVAYNSGWNACRAAMLKAGPVTGWIKCSERMPEENEEQEVLACFKGGDISTLYYFEGRWDDAYGIVPIRQDVTHWMPLPAAPEQEV